LAGGLPVRVRYMRRSTLVMAAGAHCCRSGAAGAFSLRSVTPGRCQPRKRSDAPAGLARPPVGGRARRFGRDHCRPLRKLRACTSGGALPAQGAAYSGSSGVRGAMWELAWMPAGLERASEPSQLAVSGGPATRFHRLFSRRACIIVKKAILLYRLVYYSIRSCIIVLEVAARATTQPSTRREPPTRRDTDHAPDSRST